MPYRRPYSRSSSRWVPYTLTDKLAKAAEIAELQAEADREAKKTEKAKIEGRIARIDSHRRKLVAKIFERDERITSARRWAEEDRTAVTEVGQELGALRHIAGRD